MLKKLVYLICCLVLANSAYSQDPNLVAHWKLDEGTGRVAEDSAGDYDGTLRGGPTWIDGIVDGALQFDGGDDCVEVGSYPELNNPQGSFSVSLWANIEGWSGEWTNSLIGVRSDGVGWCLRTFGGWWSSQSPDTYTMPTNVLSFTTRGIGHEIDGVEDTPSNTVPVQNEWTHIACVYDSEMNMKYIYFDGAEDAAWETNPGTIITAGQRFYIGARSNNADTGLEAPFTGMLDDVRFYDRALDADEVAVLAVPPTTVVAREPNPANGAEMVSAPLLQWTPADVAAAHNVYFGTGPTLAAEDLVSEDLRSPLYQHAAGFVPDTTYYWRIDEIEADGTVNTGKVWSFTTGPATAFYPEPQDGYRWAAADEGLSWTSGVGSTSQNVYFGTSLDDVVAGTDDTFKGNQQNASYNPGVLENDTIYFWRVDAVAADGNTIYAGEVWRFKTMPDIQISDPSLVGWWKLDEGQGTVALDWSGHGNHGTFMGDPQWTGGPDSGALDFDGFGDYVDCGNANSLVIQDSITMAVWFKIDAFIKDWEAIITKGDGAYRISRASAGGALHMGINGTATEWFDGSREVVGGEWHHAACTYDGQRATIYVDGAIDASTQSSGSINATGDSFYIGENSGVGGRFFGGTIDDVRLYNRALSQDEVRQLMEGDSSIATEPGPTNGLITDIKHSEPLSWSSGDGAVGHDVYFGTDLFDVDIADTSTPEIYRGRQGAAGYNPPEGFEWGQDYYWRIDEVKADGTVTKGNIWSFTITDYLIVDNFEDYNDYPPNEVWMTWLDGYEDPANGSSAGYPDPDFVLGEHYLETTVVHGGTQSLPLFYNNSVGLSEITRTFAPSADWTEYGVSTLTLWYSGLESNDYEPMYIALNDEVVYNDDANGGLIPEWTQWDIPLQAFADLGVNLGSVGSITIGFGNRDNPTAGGEGHVFFDDIRLYRP